MQKYYLSIAMCRIFITNRFIVAPVSLAYAMLCKHSNIVEFVNLAMYGYISSKVDARMPIC